MFRVRQPRDEFSASFGAGQTITVNGTAITFVASGATGNEVNVTDNIQTLLSKIDAITGTSTPSTVSGGVISIHTDDASSFSMTSSNSAAFAALGFSGAATAVTPPLRVGASTTTATSSGALNQATTPAAITGATLLSGAAGTDSLSSSFGVGDFISVNGTHIDFVSTGATGNQVNITDNMQTLLSKIDALSGTSTPSTISGGVISLHGANGSPLTVVSSNTAAFAAMGFSATGTATAVTTAPTSLVNGTANTVKWYTGNPGPIATARASATARVDASVKVEYGIQANESAIRNQLQTLAVFSAVTTSTTNPNGAAQVSALSSRVTQALTAQPGQQTIQDIQTDLATAQATMSDATARQKQAKAMLQNVVDQTETISPDQVASQLLALQTSLQASYQTTSMLSQLSLVKYLPAG